MEYKVYNMFELEDYPQLIKDIKVARCMKSGSSSLPAKESDEEVLKRLEDVSISETLFCSFCNTSFEHQTQQRLHYKLDWHRYNLKQHLAGLKPVTEEKFVLLTDDVSSISGSESDSEESNDEGRLQASRHSKVFFENADGKILSFYRCLLHAKKEVPEHDEELVPCALDAVTKRKWAIFMLGGGHFAAAVFNGNEATLHKTFHSYTVRAHQGATQSSRDNRSGGSHPKSAGASLRRYNEASLTQHVQEVVDSWSGEMESCGLIFYRAVGHSKTVLFGGRNPPISKCDPRLRTIPFATRRATFSEVKRVQSVLASIEVYGCADAFETAFPQSPKKRASKFNDGNSAAAQVEDVAPQSSSGSIAGTSRETEAVPKSKKRSPKQQKIDRAKPRKSPHRPLPTIVTNILAKSSSESDVGEPRPLVGEEVEVMLGERLQQFHDTVPQHVKDRKKQRGNKNQQAKNSDKEVFGAATMSLRKKLWAACRLGDTALLLNCLQTAQPIEEEEEECDDRDKVITRAELLRCLNERVGDTKETLLHIAAAGGHTTIIRALMEAGCDPNAKNKKSQTPYVVSVDKETRNTFRRFVAEFPDKYDYSKTQIASPLTEDMEQALAAKRRELRKNKREKAKEKKKEGEEKERERKKEEEERTRFLQLSDREKRALAAERRAVEQKLPVISRCFQCAVDIAGQVPFEYDIHRFCSMECLKEHKRKMKLLPQTKNVQTHKIYI